MLPHAKPFHTLLAVGLLACAAPALAVDPVTNAEGRVYNVPPVDPRPVWKPAQGPALPPMPAPGAAPMAQPGHDPAAFEQAKLDWLAECRRRYGGNKGRTAGTVIGGLVGGVAGSAIAGRGDRVVGAIAGGTLGAVAGSAIGSASDKHRARDYCESYLEDYLARQQTGFAGYGQAPGYAYGYAMQPVMMMVPVGMLPMASPAAPQHECQETTVIEEWVPVTTRKRHITHHRSVPDKRIRIVPDKRVRSN